MSITHTGGGARLGPITYLGGTTAPPPPTYTYDAYAGGWDGGPDLDYWWKMQENYTATGVGEANHGSGGTMPLYARVNVTSLTSQDSGIVLRTADNYCVTKGNANNAHRAAVLVDGTTPFTVGGWFRLTGTLGDCGVFKSNTGGQQGWAHGIHLRVADSGSYVIVRTGSGDSGSQYSWSTSGGTFSYNSVYFVVLYVVPAATVGAISFKLYINGAQISSFTTSGTSGAIAWPTDASGGVEAGIAFNNGDGQTNGSMYGKYDELFFHWGEVTAAQVLRMYELGAVA